MSVTAPMTPDTTRKINNPQRKEAEFRVPFHPVATDFAGDEKSNDRQRKQPVEEADGDVPDFNQHY